MRWGLRCARSPLVSDGVLSLSSARSRDGLAWFS